MYNLIYFTNLCVCLILHTVNASALQRSSYGEFCDDNQRKCDRKAWLSCYNSTCDCILKSEMTYSLDREKCVSMVGERCRFHVNEISSAQSHVSLYKMSDCVENSTCSETDGFCVCLNGFYESTDGECLPRKSPNITCSSNTECADTLICEKGYCQCSQGSVYGLPSNNQSISSSLGCFGKAGYILSHAMQYCINGSTNVDGFCICNEKSEYVGNDGFCHKKVAYGENCFADKECYNYFKCISNSCSCDPTTSLTSESSPGVLGKIFNELKVDFLKCVGLVDKPCFRGPFCVKDSTCKSGICKCNPGFAITSTGKCGAGFDRPCSARAPCSDSFICTEGKCTCKNPNQQRFDNSTQKCLSVVQGRCIVDEDCTVNSFCGTEESIFKHCICKAGFVRNRNRECDLAHGSRCKYNDTHLPCDRVANLQCRNDKCSCPDSLLYFDKQTRKCLIKVNDVCYENTGIGTTCVENARCEKDIENLPGRCVCSLSFEVNNERLCIITTGPTSSKIWTNNIDDIE